MEVKRKCSDCIRRQIKPLTTQKTGPTQWQKHFSACCKSLPIKIHHGKQHLKATRQADSLSLQLTVAQEHLPSFIILLKLSFSIPWIILAAQKNNMMFKPLEKQEMAVQKHRGRSMCKDTLTEISTLPEKTKCNSADTHPSIKSGP